jgi:hypothetical protein
VNPPMPPITSNIPSPSISQKVGLLPKSALV